MTQQPREATAPDRRRHDRADPLLTSLLLELTTITVDPAYLEAAGRRAVRGEPDRGGRWVAAGSLAAIGALIAVAFTNTRAGAPQADRVRKSLVVRVGELTRTTDEQGVATEALAREVAARRDAALTAATAGTDLATRLRALEFASAASPVSGPGIVVQLSDGAASSLEPATRVQDRDLQRVVNVAWAAGAEAVMVNGQRIGATTAIRQAGDSVLVDYRPVASPYRIAVVGDQAGLETAFTESVTSRTLRTIARTLGFHYRVERANRLVLPAAAGGPALARASGVPLSQERSPAP